jgi:hypothetical protein
MHRVYGVKAGMVSVSMPETWGELESVADLVEKHFMASGNGFLEKGTQAATMVPIHAMKWQ